MLSNNNTLTLYINNQKADTYDNFTIRLNNVVNNPTQIIPALGEYSFTFALPITTINANIFDFANITEKKNKFNTVYTAQLYANDMLLFSGNLKLQTTTQNSFSCNLYTNKQNATETIFQDEKLSEFEWYVPFNGIDTINDVNEDINSDYYFPLVAYHPFNKYPYTTTASGYNKYTPKNVIDQTNRWHYTDFLPSIRLSALLTKLYEKKGYVIKGDILEDKVLSNIYLSTSIADDQDLMYNYGNSNIGQCKLQIKYNNKLNDNTIQTPETYYTATHQELTNTANNYYAYNLFKYYQEKNILENNSEMISDDGIIIPTSGYYEIETDMTIGVANSQWNLKVYNYNVDNEYGYIQYSPTAMPTEFQLLKYTPNNNNSNNVNDNYINHNPIGKGYYPNEYVPQDIIDKGNYNIYPEECILNTFSKSSTTLVDNYNNPNFILGMNFDKEKEALAYAKNGTSWYDEQQYTKAVYNLNNSYYKYNRITKQKQLYTEYNNTLQNTTEKTPTKNNRELKGKAHIIVYLEKNTVLIPFLNTKHYYSPTTPADDEMRQGITYNAYANVTINVRAVAPTTTPITELKGGMLPKYTTLLNLANFVNNQTLTKDFINDVCNAFNLIVTTQNNTTTINKRKQYNNNNTNYITIDDRTTTANANNIATKYPKKQGIQLQANKEEKGIHIIAGQQLTDSQLQSELWYNKINKGYDIIEFPADETTDNIVSLNFAYTVFDKFTYNNNTLNIPIIDKESNWNHNDYDNLSDGLSLSQRFWFRNDVTNITLPLPNDKEYNITLPVITKDDITLNYNLNENSLLTHFFNVDKKMKDELTVQCYITPEEYSMLTKGANVKFNDDVYMVKQIDAFDPTGKNTTKLTLMN